MCELLPQSDDRELGAASPIKKSRKGKEMANHQIALNNKGEIHLPPEIAERYGYCSGASIAVSEMPDGIFMHRPPQGLRKIYLEPTSLCNLHCSTCVRQDWRDPQGMMEMEAYEGLIRQLPELPKVETLHFGGYGEPLLHPEIERMLRMAKEAGRKTELITNGLLLDHSVAEKLVNARLDTLIFSVDGLSPETYEAIRIDASNFFELEVATAIVLYGAGSGADLATVVGVLVEVPVMLSACSVCNRTRHWFAANVCGY